MLHFARWKVIAILVTCLAALLFALPNFLSRETLASWPSVLPRKQMALGLDLRGGAHLLLGMDIEELKADWLKTLREDTRRTMLDLNKGRDQKIGFSPAVVQGGAVQIRMTRPEDAETALKELRKLAQPIGSAVFGGSGNDIDVTQGPEPGLITLKPNEPGTRNRVSLAMSAAIETINRRINNLGTAEATVVRQGSDRILIQYPGLQDTKQLKELIGQTAKLTFHAVHPQTSAEEAKQTRVPNGYKIYEGDRRGEQGSYLLQEAPVVTGEDLVDAQPGFDQRTNEAIISFRFNQAGARKFGKFTTENVGAPFAIVLDNQVLSAPVIREPILGGSGQISGSFTVESANNLAIQLRSGALPAKLTIVEERTVGPSLGADSIEAGTRAGLIGAAATAVMTVVAYGTFGIYAVIALIINGLMIVALMSAVGSTLTLPGIAGLVLTIGMAIDANVLIYERIREELRAGKSPIAAIDAGFSRAIVTIADSQLTTLAAAIIMFWLGSGPIRGFAVTLTIGIFTSVFTAVTVTRLLVAIWLKNARAKSSKIEVPI
jgi:preprotein translocase subunit SecD